MGKILKPRGLKGAVWILIFNEIDSTLKIGSKIWLNADEGQPSSSQIESLKIAGEKSWVKLSKIHTREEAEKLKGMEVSLPRSEFPKLEDEIYLVDLIGCCVKDETNKSIGKVKDTLNLPAQNCIVVEAEGTEILIPFVDAHISLFDRNRKTLIVKDLEGLLN